MRNSRVIGRIVAIAAILVIAAGAAVAILSAGGQDYRVYALFENAGQLVKGNRVQVGGHPVGTVTGIRLTGDGQARITLSIDSGYAPLHRGVQAIVRQASLSGQANRYVDLRLPPAGSPAIPAGATLDQQSTTSAVDLDQIFNIFGPKEQKALSRFIRGTGAQYAGQGEAAARGLLYLDPAIAASSRLFSELTHDTPSLTGFITQTGRLVGDLAARREQLAGLVRNLSKTTTAIGSRSSDLQDAIETLPAFMRRANTTFVNLRQTLDDLQPLVDESKPVAPKLRRFLAQLRPLTREARPTLRSLADLIQRSGKGNDLVELTRSQTPLADIAVRDGERNGKVRQGAFPASTQALDRATPELASARPYAVDLVGWFDDYSHSGLADALGNASRVQINVNAFAVLDGLLQPVPLDQRAALFHAAASLHNNNRCPGSAERPANDHSNPYVPDGLNCDPTEQPPGS